ncbi:MAG: tetratricopeptide repeat protein [Chloroflexota bacterium]
MRESKHIPLTVLLSALALACATIACTLPNQGVIVVTATASRIPNATAVPVTASPVLTSTPAPTATSAPNVALAQADSALRNGDYDAAVTTYQSILSRPLLSVDPRLRSSASIGLGTAALREGKFADAVTALTDFIKTYPLDVRYSQAYFLRGDAYLGLAQWANAITDFQFYLQKRPGVIDSYAYERIGDANLALKNSDEALKNYGQAANAARGLVPMLALREKVAAAYLNTGSVKDALAQYDAILAVAKMPDYRASITLTAADLLLRSGSIDQAYAHYQDIVNNYSDTASAYRAMQALLKAKLPVDNLVRGRISFNAKDYNDAITALYAYTGVTPLEKIDPEVFMLLGQAYREVGNIAAANTSFQAVIDQFSTSDSFGDAWLEQGRTLYLAGKVQDAIAKYKELAEKFPKVPQGAESLWRAGYLYSTLGDTESSLATFEILGNKYKGTDWAMDGLFRGAMAAYNQRSTQRAQRLFALLATTGSGNLKAAGYLWLGRLYQIDNNQQLAREAYTEAAKADPGGYYSLRASDLLAGHGPFVPPAKLDLSFNDPAHIAEAEKWLRDKFKITQTGDLWPLSPTLVNDPRMIRGSELWAVAAVSDAKGEFESLTQDNQDNPLAVYQLASFYFRIGLYKEAINTTAKWLDDAKIETTDAPKAIAALRFPIAYYDLVLPATQKFSVDPLLVFSLIRQESLFEGVATSYAAAQGLMQIVPDTGAYIAGKLQWPDYQNNDIYKPYINVTFGVYYLREQLDTFDGNVYAALAAYNAGPAASSEWFRISNGDPDLFINAISYDQTQTYVRRIYEQYETYRIIYGTK